MHVFVARSTFSSQHVKNTTCSDRFWTFRCRFMWQAQGFVHLVQFEQNMRVLSQCQLQPPLHYITPHYTTLHYTTLRHNYNHNCTTLHYTTLITLHYITSHSTRLHPTRLHYIRLHSVTLHDTTLDHTTLH